MKTLTKKLTKTINNLFISPRLRAIREQHANLDNHMKEMTEAFNQELKSFYDRKDMKLN